MHFLCELFRSRIIKFYVIWLKNVVFRLFAHSFRPRPPFNPIFSFSLKTHNGLVESEEIVKEVIDVFASFSETADPDEERSWVSENPFADENKPAEE